MSWGVAACGDSASKGGEGGGGANGSEDSGDADGSSSGGTGTGGGGGDVDGQGGGGGEPACDQFLTDWEQNECPVFANTEVDCNARCNVAQSTVACQDDCDAGYAACLANCQSANCGCDLQIGFCTIGCVVTCTDPSTGTCATSEADCQELVDDNPGCEAPDVQVIEPP
ncbi:MAG TPA: hypothetical protein VLC09_08735, partial [Polyangiaceae bacterium]|nr:hypothetical protein [Polyangiaceae bacterium]